MQTEMVKFNTANAPALGYLALPDDDAPFAGVIVIQEWWGLNAHIKDVTERMAAEGFVALAPDLYRGLVASEPDEARKLAMELEYPRAIADIQGAVDYLKNMDIVSPKKVGVMGFCMGGGLASQMAMKGQDVGAVAVFYGRHGITEETVESVSVPYLGLFGEKDGGIPVDGVRKAESLLQQHGKISRFHIYDDAPHAFFNDTRDSYRESAADDAWNRTLGWFREHLKTNTTE